MQDLHVDHGDPVILSSYLKITNGRPFTRDLFHSIAYPGGSEDSGRFPLHYARL